MPGLQRLRMSYEEWWALPERPKAEWVDGEVVVSPPPAYDHGVAQGGLIVTLRAALPGLKVVPEVGVQLPRNRVRLPDVTVIRARPDKHLVTEVPVLVVEVLSPSTRSEDTVRKSGEYAGAGIGQYWLIDPALRAVDVFTNVDGGWELLLHLDDDHPHGSVAVGEHGTVELDLGELLDG